MTDPHRADSARVAIGPGDTAVFDLGQNMVGVPRYTLTGPAGAHVTFRFGEMLNATSNLSRARYATAPAARGQAAPHHPLLGTVPDGWVAWRQCSRFCPGGDRIGARLQWFPASSSRARICADDGSAYVSRFNGARASGRLAGGSRSRWRVSLRPAGRPPGTGYVWIMSRRRGRGGSRRCP
ncbi:family 78 glycoside hydrolase catalytic domain [Streptomyces sp. NPDC096013]|uniref:family 78 glycoside hydrolase catalytic domain n=1 Tax=Streptomyces sp. NPDC096013 TaxID=3366069 RepID=UPI00380C3924